MGSYGNDPCPNGEDGWAMDAGAGTEVGDEGGGELGNKKQSSADNSLFH
jgi:hypothetical protein